VVWNRDKRKSLEKRKDMNKIAKTAAAATFTLALIAGVGTTASAQGKKPVCPTNKVVQATTETQYTALNNSYEQYTETVETVYNEAVTDANTAVVVEIADEKAALDKAKRAAAAAKSALKAAKAALETDPTSAEKLAVVVAAKAEAKAAKAVVEAQRTLLRAKKVADIKKANEIRKATENLKNAKACKAPKPPKGKKPMKG
jgi:hypothetical protein